ncbi:hypothetical protein F5051DRAFT_507683 [Lentinula edodes]|nr:hypothetical protein F5051DRAFT_507683 [Lentinula edodes]
MAPERSTSPDPLASYDISPSAPQIALDKAQIASDKPLQRSQTLPSTSSTQISLDKGKGRAQPAQSTSHIASRPSPELRSVRIRPRTLQERLQVIPEAGTAPQVTGSEHREASIALSTHSHHSSHHIPLQDRISAAPTPPDALEQVRLTAEALGQVVEQYRNNDLSPNDAFRALRSLTDDPTVVRDFIGQIQEIQRDHLRASRERVAAAKAARVTAAAASKSRISDGPLVSPEKAVNEAAWALMERELAENALQLAAAEAEADQMEQDAHQDRSNSLQQALLKLVGQTQSSSSPGTSSGLPSSLLEAAPHLSALTSSDILSPTVSETWKLRMLFTVDSHVDTTVSLLSAQPFTDPLPQSLLKLIVKDSTTFGSEYKLVKKEHSIRSLPVTSEAQWLRVFDAWLAPVLKC